MSTLILEDRGPSESTLEFKYIRVFHDGIIQAGTAEERQILYQCYRLINATFFTLDKVLNLVHMPTVLPFDADFVSTWNTPGGTLFPEHPLTTTPDVFICAVILKKEVVSCCHFIVMPYGAEIWSVASNPSYNRSGGVKFMFYNIFYRIESRIPICLELSKDSYPYINFHDRFWLYGKLGFTLIRGTVNFYDVNGNPNGSFTNQEFRIVSPLYTEGDDGNVQVFRTADGGKVSQLSPIAAPGPEKIIMSTLPEPMIPAKITEGIAQSMERGYSIVPIPTVVPTQNIGFLSHSGYRLTDDAVGIRMSALPPNVELIIFNSPGSYTNAITVPMNWEFNQKHLLKLPIGFLKLACPGYKVKGSGNKITNADYIISTGDSPVFYIRDSRLGFDVQCQVHSYGPGDMFPDLSLSCDVGPASTDPVAASFGAYILPTAWVNPANPALPALREYVNVSNPGVIDQLFYGHPDPRFRMKPADLPPIPPGGIVKYKSTLSNLIASITPDMPLTRMCIFTCGTIEDFSEDAPINVSLRQMSKYRMTRHVNLTLENYPIFLEHFGLAIHRAFGNQFGGIRTSVRRRPGLGKTKKSKKKKMKIKH